MRSIPALLCATLALTATAQSPLTTGLAGTNEGNVGGAVYFDLQINTTVTFTQIDWHCGATTAAGNGSLNVWLGPATYLNITTNVGLWTQIANTVTVPVNPSTTVSAALAAPFALNPGSYAVALVSVGCNHGYTNGAGCTSTTNPGGCPNGVFSTAEMTFRGGNSSNVPFNAPTFTPRIWDGRLHYTIGGNPVTVASADPYGKGCYGFYTSFYESIPNGATGMDYANTSTRLAFAGPTYVVGPSTNAYLPPSPAAITMTFGGPSSSVTASSVLPGNVLPFAITYPLNGGVGVASDLEICNDGYIIPLANVSPSPTTPVDSTPTVGEFLNGPTRWCPQWRDMDAGIVGSMNIEANEPGTGALVITWNAIADPATLTTTSSFQVAFFPTGDVEYRYGTMSLNGGGTWPIVLGWTQGNGALDHAIDFSVDSRTGFATDPTDNTPLRLELDARPVLGTNPNFVFSGYPTGTNLGVRVFSFTQHNPGIPLASVGMAGCFAFVNLDVTKVILLSPGTTSDPLIPGGIPVSPIFNGNVVGAQALTLTSGFNPLGVLSSNGVRVLFGSL